MAPVTGKAPEKFVKPIPAVLIQAIVDGHVSHEVATVKIGKNSSGTGKDETKDFDAFYAEDVEGMVLLSGGKVKGATPPPVDGKDERSADDKKSGAVDHFNYGRLLTVRAAVRGQLEDQIEGPAPAILKLAKALVEGGIQPNMRESIAFVVAGKKASGNLAVDYAFPENQIPE